MTDLDANWLRANPLPGTDGDCDKNARGQLFVAGGSATVPGALRLTGEAAFRAGAGKVQLGTIGAALPALGIAVPEAAVFALPANDAGELAGDAGARIAALAARCDALVVGPGMGGDADARAILEVLLDGDTTAPLLLDAAMLHALGDAPAGSTKRPLVLTPHPGEMASLMHCDESDCGERLAEAAAERFGATIVLKGPESWVASPGQPTLGYPGGGPGLATSGSGDVLAGILGGLLARGAPAHLAAAWSAWAHGEAGRILARERGEIGFLARELVPLVPALLYSRAANHAA